MQFSIQKEMLLKPLQLATGIVDKKQTKPILGNLLLRVSDGELTIAATDTEIEIVVILKVDDSQDGAITIPGRKFGDICRAAADGTAIRLVVDNERAIVRAGRSRFVLSTLPARDFPNVEELQNPRSFQLSERVLKKLIDKTQFAMAQQDVRYYLNGLLLELGEVVRTVATDGHRLAMCEEAYGDGEPDVQQIIVPRKTVMELTRVLENRDLPVDVLVDGHHIRFKIGELEFTSKLIDGRFPDYQRVLPQNPTKRVLVDRGALRDALSRATILTSERYRSVRWQLSGGNLKVLANNQEQEESEEEIPVEYDGERIEIGFNATYVLDALGAIDGESVEILLIDPDSCCLIRGEKDEEAKFVVMPMRM